MALAVPKAFILNSLLDSKLSDSLFIINSFIIMLFQSISKNTKKMPKILLQALLQCITINFLALIQREGGFIDDSARNHITRHFAP